MHWTNAARALLNTPPVPTCPALTDALAAIAQADASTASEHLATLNEDQRLLATFLVEIEAAKANVSAEALEQLCAQLNTLPENAIDLNDVPTAMLRVWGTQVAVALPAAMVARRDAFGSGPQLISHAVERLCADGRAEQAIPYAELITEHHRGDVARAWSRIGLALPTEHAQRADALMRAAKAGSARPMIQHGAEEASAHGVAMKAFAEGDLAADHPAVAHTLKGLTKLGRHRARKDARSYGMAMASVAAAARARRDKDRAWLAIAETLAAKIWDAGPTQSEALVAVLEAQQAINPLPDAQLAAKVKAQGDAAGDAPERPEDLAERKARGEDVDAQIEAALRVWDGYGRRSVAEFVNGCRLGFDDARLEALLAVIRPEERGEALIKAAAQATEAGDARRADWLNRGYPEGDEFGIYSADLLHWLTPESQLAGEVFYAARGCITALAHLMGRYMQLGQVDAAARVIARMGQPQVGDPWVPSYRRGNRADSPLPADLMTAKDPITPVAVTLDTLKAALSQTKESADLYALALGAADEATLAKVVKASHLKKWAKKAHSPWIARVRVHSGDLDAAIAIFDDWTQGRYNEHQATALLHALADHLRVTGTVTPARIQALVTIFERIHPQWPVYAFVALARAALHVDPEARDAMTALIRSSMQSRYRRSGDFVFGLMGLGHGRIDVGDLDAGRALIEDAVRHASRHTIYFKGPALLVTLARVVDAVPAAQFEALCLKGLHACSLHERHQYAQLEQVERGLRSLWPLGARAAQITIALFEAGVLPSTLARSVLRSLWADVEHLPEPLRVLEALWPGEAVLPEIAQECVGALVVALEAAQHPEHAAVHALWTAATAD